MPAPDDIPTDDADVADGNAIEATGPRSALPFEGLVAPAPLSTDPPTAARWLAFALILVGGLLGGMIGYGTADVMGGGSLVVGLSAVVGALTGAIGVGVVAALTLRAMNEWRAVQHPEASSTERQPRIRRARDRIDDEAERQPRIRRARDRIDDEADDD